MKFSSALYACLVLLLVTPAAAQLPVPTPGIPAVQQKNTSSSLPAANVPDFDANVDSTSKPVEEAREYVDERGILRNPDGSVKLTDQAMRETQKIHEKERRIEAESGGFSWIPWNRAGSKVHAYIFERVPELQPDITQAKGEFYDIAVFDVDYDQQPDIIVWHWSNCGNKGCIYTVVFGNKVKTPERYIGHVVRPYKNGITVDGGYFGF